MVDLSTTYCGLQLKNPVVIASANITGTVENIRRCRDNGAAAVVMKSLFEKEVCRIAPTPRFSLIRRRLGPEQSFTLYSYEQASVWGPGRYAEEVAECKAKLEDIVVIPSINCETEEGWVKYARLMEQAGADILELNVSCPHSSVTFRGKEVEATIYDVVKLVRQEVQIPLVVKLSPQLTSPPNVVHRIEQLGVQGVVLFNRLTGLEIDVKTEEPIMHRTYAGHGGPWSLHLPLRWISAISPQTNLSISASGGVSCPDDVIKFLLVGADSVQTCTAVIMNGYDYISKLVRGLESWMQGKGYSSIDQFRGKAVGKILTTEEVFRQHVLQASIDPDRCVSCGRCQQVCSYFAIEAGKPYRVTDNCDGCGLCPQVCPKEAISMQTVGSTA